MNFVVFYNKAAKASLDKKRSTDFFIIKKNVSQRNRGNFASSSKVSYKYFDDICSRRVNTEDAFVSKQKEFMKLTVLFLALIAILLSLGVDASAQNPADAFQIGDKQIVVPAPSGFTEAASQIKAIKDRFTATEAPENDVLAVHIPDKDYQLFKKSEAVNLTFYTKVSVSKNSKNETATEADFVNFVQVFKKYFPAYIDPKGSLMKNTLSRISDNLTALNQEKTTFALDKPYNLGEIVNEANSYGIVVLSQMTAKIGDAERIQSILGGISAIRVRGKIVFVYTYKYYKNEQDIADLKTFSSNWLKQIAAANK